jgi:hypothetical protein
MLLSMIGAAPSVDLDDPNSVSPGILGFIAFFLLAIALYLLLRNMNSHLRRVGYQAEKEEREAKEAAARDAGSDGEPAPESEKEPNGSSAES